LLDGLPKIPDLVARTAELGMDAVALTDHGVLYGVIEFYKAALSLGIRPIIGLETYVAPNRLFEKRPKIDDSPFHLTLLTETNEGYRNLLKLSTVAQLDGFYYRPRVDKQLLERHARGLIALSGCLGGEVAQALLKDDYDAARAVARQYRDIFGEQNYFLEIQQHPNLPEQAKANKGLITLAEELGIPLVATKDSHYLTLDDAEAQDALVCVQTGRLLTDTNRLNMRDTDLHFASPAEMEKLFAALPEAVSKTAEIADRCNVNIELGKWIFPGIEIPNSRTPDEHLEVAAQSGLKERVGELTEEAKERLTYELDIIKTKGYATYFLVMADLTTWTRKQRIITTTRGSAAGSLVAYSLGITTVNPLTYDLPFERFLNPFRPTPPDIDLDIADNRRDEAIQYVKERYGEDHVAQIVTFGTMQARAAVRDIGRVLGYSYALCDRVAKMVPLGSQGFHMTIDRAIEMESDLKLLAKDDPQVGRLLALAKKVEGCVRHASVHAAGVVITPQPLVEYLPLQRESGGEKVITQYEMHAVEDIGVLKMDFLGIRNLAILDRALHLIEDIHGTRIDLDELPLDDKKTYALLARGETIGLFQLGGSGMTRYLKELRPTTIHDIMAMVALFRPGPMNNIPHYIERKHNPKLISYLHPKLKPILERSFGILTYQDDVLLIAIHIAGYTWEEADKLRRAIGKKIPEEMEAQREKFLRGCVDKGGIPGPLAEELWKLIEPFAAYGFNKSHAASYGIVAYQTAYLKANYPSLYMTAVLQAESGNMDKIGEIVEECRRMGIDVLPPSINESDENFTRLDDKHIRFGLMAIKNVGEEVATAVITERRANGAFTSLEDFLRRLQTKNFNKRFLESAIRAGCLDDFGERGQLIESVEALLKYNRAAGEAVGNQQAALFGDVAMFTAALALAPAPPIDRAQRLAWERELLGLYVTEHPLAQFDGLSTINVPFKELTLYSANDIIVVAGVVDSVRKIMTKAGEPMCFVRMSDVSGSAELIVFPGTFKKTAEHWVEGTVLLVGGKVSRREGEVQILADTVEALVVERFPDTLRRWQKLRFRRRQAEPAASGDFSAVLE